MVVRHRKKKNKMRGNRTHGGGNTKNRRGSGIQGGHGRAGSHKHKFSKYWQDFGVKIRLKPKKALGKALNLEELQKMIPAMIEGKRALKEAEGILIDGRKAGIAKVLGKGNIKEKIILSNVKATAKAIEKILQAGGSVKGIEKAKRGKD